MSGKKAIIKQKDMIALSDVKKQFGEREVLKGITLNIKAGEIFGLLGPSGAGKTTMIKIVTGQLAPTSGYVTLNGEDTVKPGGRMYCRIGMMMDKLGLYERLSCYDNLKLFAKIYRIPEKRICEVLKKVGLWEERKCQTEKLCSHLALLHEGRIVEYGEPKEICRKYNHQNKLQIRLYDGTCLEVENGKKGANIVKEYLESGMIETIHSTEPNLETVFMELTGRTLADM